MGNTHNIVVCYGLDRLMNGFLIESYDEMSLSILSEFTYCCNLLYPDFLLMNRQQKGEVGNLANGVNKINIKTTVTLEESFTYPTHMNERR